MDALGKALTDKSEHFRNLQVTFSGMLFSTILIVCGTITALSS